MKLAYTLITTAVMLVAVYCGIQDYSRSPAFHRLFASDTDRPSPASRPGAAAVSASDEAPKDVVSDTENLPIESSREPAADPTYRQGGIQEAINEAEDLYERARQIYGVVVTENGDRSSLHGARKLVEDARELLERLPEDSSQVRRLKRRTLQLQNSIIKELPL